MHVEITFTGIATRWSLYLPLLLIQSSQGCIPNQPKAGIPHPCHEK